jgi:hypothetical protein
LNDGAGRFQEVANNVGGDLRLDSRSVAYADFWGDGSLDMVIANQNQPVKVYRNYTDPNHNWVSFDLEGTKSNRSAVGAIIILHWNGKRSRKSVTAGEAFSSQSQRVVHFGLGEVGQVEKAEIRWPSGIVQTIENPEINVKHKITEQNSE